MGSVKPLEVNRDTEDVRGIVAKLPIGKEYGISIMDAVVQEIRPSQKRGDHYHTAVSGKIEIFVPISGKATLTWFDMTNQQRKGEMEMASVFDAGLIYWVDPETCHTVCVSGEYEDNFVMLSLNNISFYKESQADCHPQVTTDKNSEAPP